MKILVLNPASKFSKNVIRDVVYGCWCKGKRIGGATVPPFVLMQIASVLELDKKNEVLFIDAMAEKKDIEEVSKLAQGKDVVIISTSTMSFEEDADYLQELKKAEPKIKTIVFGSHPTFMPEYCLSKNSVDYVILNENEFVIKNIIDKMNKGETCINCSGVGLKDSGKIIINNRDANHNLDDLPYINLKFLPKGVDYFNPIVSRMPYIAISSSRGCPGKCTFCTAPYFEGNILRFQSAEYLLNEIRYFSTHGIKEIYFRDETFFVNKTRDHEIFKNIIKEKIDITWLANARISLIDEETIRLAKEAGCHTIKFGVESGNQELLNGMKKGYRLEQGIKIFDFCNKTGIKTHAHVMIGVPGESEETLKETLDYVKRLNPTTATFGICTPYPGSELFNDVARVYPDIIKFNSTSLKNLHQSAFYNQFYTNLKPEIIENYLRKAYRKFYLHPNKIFDIAWKNLRSINDIKRLTIAGANVLDFIFYGE